MERIKSGDIVRVNTPQGYVFGQANMRDSDRPTWWYVMPVGSSEEIDAHSDSILVIYRPSMGELES